MSLQTFYYLMFLYKNRRDIFDMVIKSINYATKMIEYVANPSNNEKPNKNKNMY